MQIQTVTVTTQAGTEHSVRHYGLIADSPIGPQVYCHGCEDWWPATTEFWRIRSNKTLVRCCRACEVESAQTAGQLSLVLIAA